MQYDKVVIVNIVKQVEALAKGFFRVKVQYGFKVLRKRGRHTKYREGGLGGGACTCTHTRKPPGARAGAHPPTHMHLQGLREPRAHPHVLSLSLSHTCTSWAFLTRNRARRACAAQSLRLTHGFMELCA